MRVQCFIHIIVVSLLLVVSPVSLSNNLEASSDSARPLPISVTALGGYNDDDTRHLYEVGVIRLLLEKTEQDFGPFILNEAKGMTHSDSIEVMTNNRQYPNFVRSFGYTPEMTNQKTLSLIPFPLWRGLLGYRTCFVSQKIFNAFAHANTTEALLGFSHGQGEGWIDADILRYNKFDVVEIADYTELFKKVAKNEFDLFCRGANEVREEFGRFSYLPDFVYDQTKVFYYPFPHFLFTHKDNVALKKRLEAGISRIISDGSFQELWWRFHRNSIRFVNLAKRQTIHLENPFMKTFDTPYEHLIYKPSEVSETP